MRQGLPSLLLALSFAISCVHADEGSPDPTAARQAGLEQRLSENELQRNEPSNGPGITDAERAQLAQLRRENQQLRLQLQHGQPQQKRWLNDQQQWFAVGGGVGVLGFLLGVLTTRGRRRRQWLN
ncbi:MULTISPECIES: hypothetical protein [Pseudomonadaceae]|uniref:hypothetical protein n=1 Tax=Pseudomonadaceae TaxID=135621 RepID=UPI0015E3803F|nr:MULTISPECIES: hypothetical protein [Pseudomonadaceae]MBA1277774.1 hypothetical protein [Stutzerimonas stutzeri]MBC8651033.1 hypothetical protein [Pseudomonas sp. MT4]QXY91026.1 hypothetical protein GYM54_05170 [Pseudomonas sp. MTM4]